MRATPMVGTKLWFGPRRVGWGWRPLTWEGWVVVLGAGAASLALRLHLRRRYPEHPEWLPRARVLAGAATVAAMVLKGTAPGGRGRAAELDVLLNGPATPAVPPAG